MKKVKISEIVAVLIDGNNIEISIHNLSKSDNNMVNFDTLIPKLVGDRDLRAGDLIYLREGDKISQKLADRLYENFKGRVLPCGKNADVNLYIEAVKIMNKVDTIIIMSGDKDYIPLVKYLKQNGIKVEIAALKISAAIELIAEADSFTEITKDDWFPFERAKPKRAPKKKHPKKLAEVKPPDAVPTESTKETKS